MTIADDAAAALTVFTAALYFTTVISEEHLERKITEHMGQALFPGPFGK